MKKKATEALAQMREQIVGELNIGHLSKKDQDQIIEGLGEVLFKRALTKVVSRMPAEGQAAMAKLLEEGAPEGDVRTLIERHVPDSREIIAAEIRAGLDEHKRRVTEIAAKRGDSE